MEANCGCGAERRGQRSRLPTASTQSEIKPSRKDNFRITASGGFVRIVVIGSFFIGRPTLSEAAIECFKLQFEMRAIGFYDGKDSKVRWLAGCRCLVWEGWMATSPCPVFSFQ